MTLDEAIKRFTSNAEYERQNGNLQGCLEFRQLAKWLKELKAYRSAVEKFKSDLIFKGNTRLTATTSSEWFNGKKMAYKEMHTVLNKYLSEN